MKPCLNGDGPVFMAVANLQGTGPNGVYQFLQIGLWKFDNPGNTQCGPGVDAIVSDQTTFAYTPNTTNGVVCKAWWYDINDDGVADNPIAGHTYRMQILEWENSTTGNNWQFCITDVGTGVGDCYNRLRQSSDGGLAESGGNYAAWWACEVYNLASGHGVNNGSADITMKEFAYEKGSTPGVWTYTENSPLELTPWGFSHPTYYSSYHSQVGLGESLACRTLSH
jgi:hypothetical protein